MDAVVFRVPGVPVGQPRHSRGKFGNLYIRKTSSGDEHPVHAYKLGVSCAALASARGCVFASGALGISIAAWFPRPKRKIWKTKPMPAEYYTGKPDNDNIEKAVWDALSGVLWSDDTQIAKNACTAMLCAGGMDPYTEVRVWRLT